MDKVGALMESLPTYRQEGYEPPSFNFLPFFLVFTLSVFALETYLDLRQHKRLKATEPPATLLEIMQRVEDDCGKTSTTGDKAGLVQKVRAKFVASQSYGLDKSRFHFVDSLVDLMINLATNLLGLMPLLWDFSAKLLTNMGVENGGDIPTSLVFMFLRIIIETIVGLPFSMYSTFVVEGKHGFNKQTLGVFFADKVGGPDNVHGATFIKGIILSVLIGAPALAMALHIVEWGGRFFYVYLWVFMLCLTLVMLTVYPVLIMPLFNKYTPLEEGELKTAIEDLAAKVKFPLTKLFVVDGSKRSGHSNAYFYGFFKNKRIVLFDTLIKQATKEEIVAILGHELGHWKMSHTIQGLVISQIYMLISFSAFALASELGEPLRLSFGYSVPASFVTLYLFFAVMWAPVDHVLSVAMNVLSRKNEFEADAYAVGHGFSRELQTGLVKLQLENLGNMNPDPWYSAFHYSHPPLVERLQAITSENGKSSATAKKTN
ncbi:unnamed protein product [Discosporangium mesarthrocarpum]